MGFEDIEKRMATRAPRSSAFVFVLAGLVFIGLNFVINQVARESPGGHWSTYSPAGVGIVCVICGLITKRYPSMARPFLTALVGVALIVFNAMINAWSRDTAIAAGRPEYWKSDVATAFGCLFLIFSAWQIVDDIRKRRAP